MAPMSRWADGKEHRKHKAEHKKHMKSCITKLSLLVFLAKIFGKQNSPPYPTRGVSIVNTGVQAARAYTASTRRR